jgi:signal transduction histidine kinase
VRANVATEEELLNRIAAIQAAAEILDDNQEFSHADRQAFLTAIQTETARLHALVRQIASLFPDRLRVGSATPA